MRRLNYPIHFTALAAAAAALFAASHWVRPNSALIAVAVYGIGYSSVTAMTLRGGYALRDKLLFVAAAIALSMLSFSVSFFGGRRVGWSAPIEYLVFCAGTGAFLYMLLLRYLFMPDLSRRALVSVPLVSVLAVAAVFKSGLYSQSIETLPVAWWFATSAALWCEERLRSMAGFSSGNPLRCASGTGGCRSRRFKR